MRVPKYLVPILVLTALLGSVLVAQATNTWSVSGKDSIDVSQLSSSEEIRGWMTLQQVADGFQVPVEVLLAQIGAPADATAETPLKDLEKVVEGFEITALRDVVDAYLQGDQAIGQTEPMKGENLIVSTPTATEEDSNPLADPVVSETHPEGTGPTPLPAGEVLPGSEIKGRHTLLDISQQCQVPLPDLLSVLGLPPDTDQTILTKDLIGMGEVGEVQDVRDAVTALQSR